MTATCHDLPLEPGCRTVLTVQEALTESNRRLTMFKDTWFHIRPQPAAGHDFVETRPGDCPRYMTYSGGGYRPCSNPPESEGYCVQHIATIRQTLGWSTYEH